VFLQRVKKAFIPFPVYGECALHLIFKSILEVQTNACSASLPSQRFLAPSRALQSYREDFNKMMGKLISKRLSNALAENKLKMSRN